jgi:PAS domain-containing protein
VVRRHPNGGTAGAVDGNTFRAELAAALRDAPDPEAAHVVTTRLLATRLGVDRAFYALLERDALVVLQEHHGDAPSVAGRHRAEDVGLGLLAEVREGRTVVVTDVTTDARVDANGRARAEEAGVGALIAVPLPATDGLDGVLVAHSSTPRDWTDDEVALVTGAAAQVPLAVERVRAQQALRESEARFGALFSAIDEGFCVCEMIVDEDGTPRDYRFLDMNPRFEALTGLSGARGRTALELVPDLERRWIETYAAVAFSGRPARFQDTSEALGRTFDVFATPVEPRGRFALVFTDITARTRADAVLRDAAARDRFRALLTDTLRTLTDPFEVQRASVRLLGEHMGVDRAFFAEADGDVVTIHHDHTSGVPSAAGTYRLPDFGRARSGSGPSSRSPRSSCGSSPRTGRWSS